MKPSFFRSLFLLICAFSITLYSEQKRTNLAVLDIRGDGEVKQVSAILSDRLRNELFNTGVFTVMERGEMDNILKEQGFQQSGTCDDKACMVEVGQLLGVEKMVAGSLGQIGTKYLINLRIIDVKTGQILDTYSGECKCPVEELDAAMQTAAMALANKKNILKENPVVVDKGKTTDGPVFLWKHQLAIEPFQQSADCELNDLFLFLESQPAYFPAFLKGDETILSQSRGTLFSYSRRIKNHLALNFRLGFQSAKANGDYLILRRNPLINPSINPAGHLSMNANLTQLPLQAGVRWLFRTDKPLSFHTGADLMFSRISATIDWDGIYKWSGNPNGDSLGPWLDLAATAFGINISGGTEYRFKKHWAVGADLALNFLSTSVLSGDGNMDALKRIFTNDSLAQASGLPANQGDGSEYSLITFKVLGKENTFVQQGQNKFSNNFSNVEKIGLDLSALQFRFSLKYGF